MSLRELPVVKTNQVLNPPKKEWCNCKDHNSYNFTVVTNFYCMKFVPDGWMLDCKTIDTTDDEHRYLYFFGHCLICGGFMRSGTSLPVNFSGDKLLNEIYHQMKNRRPYESKKPDGTYYDAVTERARWYEMADKLPEAKLDEIFLSLFKRKDKAAVQQWLNKKVSGGRNE